MTVGAASRDTPRDRIAAACVRHSEGAVVAACVALLSGDEVDDELVVALGGAHARAFLAGRDNAYWGRVWGARGLLYAFDDTATEAVVRATADSSWRVREMCAKVVAKRHLDDAAGAMAGLRADAVARVRAASERALSSLARSPSRPTGPVR